jgi:hypothetical protein
MKSKVKENHIIRLFQVIRHQGSEQVSKPDIHHVDFSLTCVQEKRRRGSLPLELLHKKCRYSVVDVMGVV